MPVSTNETTPASEANPALPFWSVMIPTYRPPEHYLRQALESVLQQDPGRDQMQIEVVDDCSPAGDTAALVRRIAGDRVACSRTPRNLGLAGCWNTCIERARGRWVHILHQDDYVLPGFYGTLARAAEMQPAPSLLATRSFLVDGVGVITGVGPRVQVLEKGGRIVADFFYGNPIQCPPRAVRRDFYQANGGFRADLRFALDCEMWVRAISRAGGVVLPDVLACYRTAQGNETNRLWRTADNLRDMQRFNELLAAEHEDFEPHRGYTLLAYLAVIQAEFFKKAGDAEGRTANLEYLRAEIPLKYRLRQHLAKWGRKILG